MRVIESDLYFKKVILATVLRIDWRSTEEESAAEGLWRSSEVEKLQIHFGARINKLTTDERKP